MSGRQKLVVLAVSVLVLVAFVASVLHPGGSGDGPVGWLGRLVGDPAAAAQEDLAPDCREPDGRLVFGGSCAIVVAPSSSDLRTVALTAEHPISVAAPAPTGEITVETDVAAGETVRVAVGPDGAEIQLACAGSEDCVVRIGAGDG